MKRKIISRAKDKVRPCKPWVTCTAAQMPTPITGPNGQHSWNCYQLLEAWYLILDTQLWLFSFLSLSQHCTYCEIWVRSLFPTTLPEEDTEATYRMQILEESATKLNANTISSTKAHLHIVRESLFFRSGVWKATSLSKWQICSSVWMNVLDTTAK